MKVTEMKGSLFQKMSLQGDGQEGDGWSTDRGGMGKSLLS